MIHCNQCDADWEPRVKGGEPVQCPRCKRVDWNEPKKARRGDGLDDNDKRGAVEREGDGATVPTLPKAESTAKQLRKVQPVRGKLVRRGESGKKPEGRAVGEVSGKPACPVDPKHRFLPNGTGFWCSDCGRGY